MKKTKISLFCTIILVLISFTSLVLAYDYVTIDMKSVFEQDEYTSFDYTFTGLEGEVEYYAGVRCDNLPLGFYPQKVNLTSESLTLYYTGFKVDKQYENCYAYVNVIKPFEIKVTKPFIIQNADSEFDFDLETCKDSSCSEKSVVFLKNENMYLSYESSIDNPSINALLTYPDGKKEQIDIPSSIKAGQIGTYTIEVTASKEGYITAIDKVQFGVIEKHTEVRPVSVCNADGVCDSRENPQNCPQDCSKKEISSLNFNQLWIVVLLLAIILVVVVLIMRDRKKKKKVKNKHKI